MRFSQETREYFLGPMLQSQVGCSSDPEIRALSASGGLVSTTLIHLLESGQVDGALVCRLEVIEGRLRAAPFIASNRQEVLSAGGSIYLDVNPLGDSALLQNFKGRLAMVGLPCHLDMLAKMKQRAPALNDKIIFTIGLFCGHNSRRELIERVLTKRRVDLEKVASFRFRRGLWRGRTWVHYNDGKAENFPFQAFSRYQNLHFFTLQRCLRCADHTAETADVSVGDLWSKRLKAKPIKHSAILQRSDRGQRVVREMMEQGKITMESCSAREIFQAQKRALTCHKSVYTRYKLGPYFGFDLPAVTKTPTPWNHWLASLIVMANAKWSGSPRFKRLIFNIPKPLLQAYLLVFKGLTHI